jgi:hypothetical protein
MTDFVTNPNQFSSSIHTLKKSFHAYTNSGVPKGTKSQKIKKAALIKIVTKAIEDINTDDFGIRVMVMKVKE